MPGDWKSWLVMPSPPVRTNIPVRECRLLPRAATTGLCNVSPDLRLAPASVSRREKRLAAGSGEMWAGFHWREPPITAHAISPRELPSRIMQDKTARQDTSGGGARAEQISLTRTDVRYCRISLDVFTSNSDVARL
jgi:hypothetical protein